MKHCAEKNKTRRKEKDNADTKCNPRKRGHAEIEVLATDCERECSKNVWETSNESDSCRDDVNIVIVKQNNEMVY